jgi:hypothetical protein
VKNREVLQPPEKNPFKVNYLVCVGICRFLQVFFPPKYCRTSAYSSSKISFFVAKPSRIKLHAISGDETWQMWLSALMPRAEQHNLLCCWLHWHGTPFKSALILRQSCGTLIFWDSAPLFFSQRKSIAFTENVFIHGLGGCF